MDGAIYDVICHLNGGLSLKLARRYRFVLEWAKRAEQYLNAKLNVKFEIFFKSEATPKIY